MERVQVHLREGETLLDRLLKDGLDIAHDCGGKLACSSCRVVISEGLEALAAASEDELDLLDRAGAAGERARLACQAKGIGELSIEVARGPTAPADAALRPVSVTARAAAHLVSQLVKHPGAAGVRVSVAAAGCSGLRYKVAPATDIRNDDTVFKTDELSIVVDAASLPYLRGTTLDALQEGLARRLRFANPNARQSCGCGESFSVLPA
jgi:iron-sulfur cluster assembly protein